jgi:hypothetical protein
MNEFVKIASNVTTTENGALSFKSTNSTCVDQFGKAASYIGRDIDIVFQEQDALWAENHEFAIKFPFYLRMITRKTKMADGSTTENTQKGQGCRDEAFKRFLWIAQKQPKIFYDNLWLIPVIGSWKDLWVLLTMDESLNREAFFKVIAEGCQSKNQIDLVKKYLPQIRSVKKCKTHWAMSTNNLAKSFCNWAGWNAEEYRRFKSTGKAHEFQHHISQGKYDLIEWDKISGKALLLLSSGKFLQNHNLLNEYIEWIKNTPTAKFNGYPHELGVKLARCNHMKNHAKNAFKLTVDAQFDYLISTSKDKTGGITGNVWCALDTSGSMMSKISRHSQVSAYDVCISLGIYFATLNEGAFHKNVIMFDNVSYVQVLKGSFSDMYYQIENSRTAWGSTNFSSVVDEITRIRQTHSDIRLEDYPTTLLVVSDMQFNPTSYGNNSTTNVDYAKSKLSEVFPKEWVEKFKFVWWQVNARTSTDVPSTLDDNNSYFFSGFDGGIINLLLGNNKEIIDETTGEKRTPTIEEIIEETMGQYMLQLIKI